MEVVQERAGSPDALMTALEEEGISPQAVLHLEFFRGLEAIGAFAPLPAVSAVDLFGFEDIYTEIQLVFEGGEDLASD